MPIQAKKAGTPYRSQRAAMLATRRGDLRGHGYQPVRVSADEWVLATPGATPPGQDSMAWSDVLNQAVQNLPGSAAQLARDTVEPILHPIEAAQNIAALTPSGSMARSMAMRGEQPTPEVIAGNPNITAVRDHYADRYGGMENIKRTIATDPAGAMFDAAGLATGGVVAAGKAPAVAAKAAGAARRVPDFARAEAGRVDISPQTSVFSGAKQRGRVRNAKALKMAGEDARRRHMDIPEYVPKTNLSKGTQKYVGGAHSGLNQKMREGVPLDAAQMDMAREIAGDMRPLSGDHQVFRGIEMADEFRDIKPGDTIDFDSFTSTSGNPNIPLDDKIFGAGNQLLMEFKIPAGTRAVVTNEGETEILLPPGYRMKIKEVQNKVPYSNYSGAKTVEKVVIGELEAMP